MPDRPILFSAPMVQAILAGRKTVTRRMLKPQPEIVDLEGRCWIPDKWMLLKRCPGPRIAMGDRLWVRETHQFRGADYGDGDIEWFRCWGTEPGDNWDPQFPAGWEPSKADAPRALQESEGEGIIGYATRRRPGIHMPRWASRLTLTVTDVKVERLQDITEQEAEAEGIERLPGHGWRAYGLTPRPFSGAAPGVMSGGRGIATSDPLHSFATLWEHINGPDAWDANPFVAAYTFTVAHKNIDAGGSDAG